MIVKNEGAIIGRCLKAARRFFDHWIVVDTGSTDDTEAEVRKALAGVPGELHHRPWRGFGPAKTDALDLAREAMDGRGYALILDADEILNGDLPTREELTHDRYGVWMQINNLRYHNSRLFKLNRRWTYEGVLHEFPTSSESWNESFLDKMVITTPRDGARSKNPHKYAEDAETLEKELVAMGDLALANPSYALSTRYRFYLAQSYRDSGNDTKALENYLIRAEQGGGLNWEEIYVSLLEAARAMDRMGMHQDAERTYLKAHHTWPDRAEAPRALEHIFTARRDAAEGKQPIGALFVEGGVSPRRKNTNGDFDYKQYWQDTYEEGGNSGPGSYGVLGQYKTRILNDLIKEHALRTVIDFGVGDGNQIKDLNCESYLGLDVSANAVERCSRLFKKDMTKSFLLYSPKQFTNHGRLTADLVTCLDVLYHITDEQDFKKTLDDIFSASTRYVVLYTKITTDDELPTIPIIKDRDILNHLKRYEDRFVIRNMPNHPHPTLSSARFIVLEKNA
jgi:tetratricopeptide (TPR) repeat protein